MVVAGYHLIWTAYGSWLPNDPRGSTSWELRSVDLQDLGELHFGRKRLQPARRILKAFYDEAKQRLKHELLTLDDRELPAVAQAFASVIKSQRYTCYACAILPDHLRCNSVTFYRDRSYLGGALVSSRCQLAAVKLRSVEGADDIRLST